DYYCYSYTTSRNYIF
nr:immunoglobulin light chain junction region [Macaca mulatta]MOW04343.1 immunoglobulin light chain junction region [Macaca mulatta]MOW04656.1 immunoglobulin light chain junction region [Macaca mulatta]MOW05923.1 immunoglobulin light chain junction region [Macaca mulatta]